MKSMAESSALLNETLATGLQSMFNAMQRPGNIRYQSSNPPGFTANNWFNQSQFPPFTQTHTCHPPGNIQSCTILTLMGTLIGNIMGEYLRVSNVFLIFKTKLVSSTQFFTQGVRILWGHGFSLA